MPALSFADAMQRILARIPPPDRIISALSGGMDSVALLHLLIEWRKKSRGCCPILAAHLNHGLRGQDAARDQQFCRELAQFHGIEFATQTVDAAETARREGLGVEEAGRILRYRFFHSLGTGGSLVLTGHHADDQAETILMNLRRGAHRRGLSGMRELSWVPVPPDTRVRVGRPLLGIAREALGGYAAKNSLSWREDASNADVSYTRNRIRHRIIPALESIMPGFRARLLARAASLGAEEEKLTAEGRDLAERLCRREHGGRLFFLGPEAFMDQERFLYALRHVAEDEMGTRLPYGAALSRLSQLAESGRLGETLSLPGQLRVRKERDGIFFFFPSSGNDSYGEFILPDPPFEVRAYGMTVRAEWLVSSGTPPEADMADSGVEWLNPAAIRWPLRLRPPRPGERFRPLGAPGSRKIQDILVDLKTPRRVRDFPRVVADHAGALWLWPFRLAERARLPGHPLRALRVEIRSASMPGKPFFYP